MGEIVSFKSNGASADGYLALPPAGHGPAVIVIQEWWGLVPHIKDVADRYAQAGFVALAPDLYHGKATSEPGDAGKLMMALNILQAEKDLRGAVDYLLAHPATAGKKVGVVGFCMGGALSLYAASTNPDTVGACIIYYGGHPNVKPDLAALKAPVLGFYGERDSGVTPASALALQSQLQALGKRMDVHIYPGAGHAFFNSDRPAVYDKAAAEDTWTRAMDFFRTNL
ncbi:MAG: dienelactone hydrolase family protein [Chloroflexi bacterium]|nr:dienelactone hydrolase family protein [Chloroflexota bacterium]